MFKMSNTAFIVAAALAAVLAPVAVRASPTCTKEPKEHWLGEADMKAKIAEMGYRDIRAFKTTKTGCYEIYGRDAEGRKAEVYFDPVDGRVVQANID